jgi:hypothetical protein
MARAELSVSRAAAGPRTPAIRRVIANSILVIGILALVLWGLALTSAILPPWPVLLTLALLVALIAFFMWKSLVKIYARAQIRLAETFSEQHEPEPAIASPPEPTQAFPILAGAQMEPIPVTAGSPADGKLIRELGLRTATGASIVAIDRHGSPIVNPGPDEELRAGDRIYLLGTAEQIHNATTALRGIAQQHP